MFTARLPRSSRDWWGMTGQSFIAFGDKLAREVGATFKIRNGQGTFVPRNEGIGAGARRLAACPRSSGKMSSIGR